MGLNVPTFVENDFSFGPGRVFIGASGTTPSVDIGGITEDGVSIELENEKRDIVQGNPKMIVYTFSQVQGARVTVTGIEHDQDTWQYGLGAANTTTSGSVKTMSYGGDPIVERIAVHVQHKMAVTSNTMDAYLWTCVSDNNLVMPIGHDEHQFEYVWKCQRSLTNWAGGTLAFDEQLLRIERQL